MEYNEKKRQAAVRVANAINAIGGVPVSDYAKLLQHRWAAGEITGEQLKELLAASHKKLTEQTRLKNDGSFGR